jgi:CBS domain containing-hemolysin-like protein
MVVVNEFGGLLGIFTLEDILEELVGEIMTTRKLRKTIRRSSMKPNGSELVVDGTTELRVLEAHFGQELAGKPYDSVNLWIITHLERIPAPGETFVAEGLRSGSSARHGARIHEVRISRSSVTAAGSLTDSAAEQPATGRLRQTASPQ